MIREWLEYLREGLKSPPPEDRIATSGSYPDFKTSIQPVWKALRSRWKLALMSGGLLVVGSLLPLVQPMVYRFLMDDVIVAKKLALLVPTLLVWVALHVGAMFVGYLRQFWSTRFNQEMMLDLQEQVIGHTLRLPKLFFDSSQTGYLMNRLNEDVQGLQWFFSGTLAQVLVQLIQFFGGVAFILYLDWQVSVPILVSLPLLIFVVRYFSGRTYRLAHRQREQRAQVVGGMQEVLSSLHLIKAFATERRSMDKLIRQLKQGYRIGLEQMSVSTVHSMAIGVIPNVARFLILALGAYWIIEGRWSIGTLLAFQSYVGNVFGPATGLASLNTSLQSARASLDRVGALMQVRPEQEEGQGASVERLEGEIEFQDVCFWYPGRDPVLEGISFRIRPGERIGIAGESGVGKTTLISLLLGFYPPSSGRICLDGRLLEDLNLRSLRERIGYVSQHIQLLSGSVMENLRYGKPDLPDSVVVEVARVAGIHDFILQLPDGYQTVLGESGVNLSAGQRQRLALARALAKEADLLILDEPASALDNAIAASILASVKDCCRDKTVLVVAHKFENLEDMDKVLVLADGRVAGYASCDRLLDECDEFQRLFRNGVESVA